MFLSQHRRTIQRQFPAAASAQQHQPMILKQYNQKTYFKRIIPKSETGDHFHSRTISLCMPQILWKPYSMEAICWSID
jgi:hypothetical protein